MAKNKKNSKNTGLKSTAQSPAKKPRKPAVKDNPAPLTTAPDLKPTNIEPPIEYIAPEPVKSEPETGSIYSESPSVPGQPAEPATKSTENHQESSPEPVAASSPQSQEQVPEEQASTLVQADTMPRGAPPEPITPKQPARQPVMHTSAHNPTSPKNLSGPPLRRRSKRLVLIAILFFVVLLGVGLARKYQPGNTQSQTEQETRQLISEVSKHAVLPTDETPSVTTVVSKDKVSQAFLQDAKNGDIVLLYFQSGKAIVYRPATHQVVNIGPLVQPDARVFIRSGTGQDESADVTAKLASVPGFKIVSKDVSETQNYQKTLVVDLSGSRPDLANRVAKLLGGSAARLPSNESAPEADILVIVGKNTQ